MRRTGLLASFYLLLGCGAPSQNANSAPDADVLSDTASDVTAAFDGYVEQTLRVSGTCLIHVDRNRYSVPAEWAGKVRTPDVLDFTIIPHCKLA